MEYEELGKSCDIASGSDIRAIGWLSGSHQHPSGPVSEGFVERLKQPIETAWQPVASPGIHSCGLCKTEPAMDSGVVLNPTDSVLFIALTMVAHYIGVQQYHPSDQFIQAVMDCPAQSSPQYKIKRKRYLHH